MSFLKTCYFILILLAVTIYSAGLLLSVRFFYWLIGKDYPTELGHSRGIAWGKAIMKATPGWHTTIAGKENIPSDRPYVIIANHESMTDIFAIYLLEVQFKWLSKKEVFKVPIVGYCMKICGYIPISRGQRNSHKEALDRCAAWIKKGVSMLFFPEGTRSLDGKPKKFKVGAFKLAIETDVPILPVILINAGKLLKKGSLCPNPANLIIQVLPPVHAHKSETFEDFTHRVEQIVVKEHARLSATN